MAVASEIEMHASQRKHRASHYCTVGVAWCELRAPQSREQGYRPSPLQRSRSRTRLASLRQSSCSVTRPIAVRGSICGPFKRKCASNVGARVVEPYKLAGERINRREIGALVEIAPRTGPGHIVRCRRATMLLRSDVVGMMRQEAQPIGKQAVFAATTGSIVHCPANTERDAFLALARPRAVRGKESQGTGVAG